MNIRRLELLLVGGALALVLVVAAGGLRKIAAARAAGGLHHRAASESLASAAPAQSEQGSSCSVRADKVADPAALLLGEASQIELRFEVICPERELPVDVAIVLDRSASMMGWPLEDAKEAAVSFVELMDLSRSRVSVVSFSTTGRLEARLSRNERHIREVISRLAAEGGTNISAGLREAGRSLDQPGDADAVRAIVILTDGRDGLGPDAVLQQAELLKQRGVYIVSIGLGLQADVELLKNIAGTPDDFHYAPRSRDLADVYARIASRLEEISAGDVVVIDELPADMQLVPGSVAPAASVDLAARRLTWRQPLVPVGGLRFSYEVRPAKLGWRPTNTRAEASFVDSEGRSGLAVFPVPKVLVLAAPLPTPTGGVTPTPPSTPTGPALATPSAIATAEPTARQTGAATATRTAMTTTTAGTPSGRASATATAAASATATTPPFSTASAVPSGTAPAPPRTVSPGTPDEPTSTPLFPSRPHAVFLPAAWRRTCRTDTRPVSVVVVLDASTTMERHTATGRRKIDAAIEASVEFVSGLDVSRVHVGIVSFNREAYAHLSLTDSRSDIIRALREVKVAEGSRIDLGLETAAQVLSDSSPRGARSVVVLLTDGHPVGAAPRDVIRAADALAASAVKLYVGAIGPGANIPLLSAVAGDTDRLLDAGDGTELRRVFLDISGLLDCP